MQEPPAFGEEEDLGSVDDAFDSGGDDAGVYHEHLPHWGAGEGEVHDESVADDDLADVNASLSRSGATGYANSHLGDSGALDAVPVEGAGEENASPMSVHSKAVTDVDTDTHRGPDVAEGGGAGDALRTPRGVCGVDDGTTHTAAQHGGAPQASPAHDPAHAPPPDAVTASGAPGGTANDPQGLNTAHGDLHASAAGPGSPGMASEADPDRASVKSRESKAMDQPHGLNTAHGDLQATGPRDAPDALSVGASEESPVMRARGPDTADGDLAAGAGPRAPEEAAGVGGGPEAGDGCRGTDVSAAPAGGCPADVASDGASVMSAQSKAMSAHGLNTAHGDLAVGGGSPMLAHGDAVSDAASVRSAQSKAMEGKLNTAHGDLTHSALGSASAGSPTASPGGTAASAGGVQGVRGAAAAAVASQKSSTTDPLNVAHGDLGAHSQAEAWRVRGTRVSSTATGGSGRPVSTGAGSTGDPNDRRVASPMAHAPAGTPDPARADALAVGVDDGDTENETAHLRSAFPTDTLVTITTTGQVGRVAGVARGRVGVWANGTVVGVLPSVLRSAEEGGSPQQPPDGSARITTRHDDRDGQAPNGAPAEHAATTISAPPDAAASDNAPPSEAAVSTAGASRKRKPQLVTSKEIALICKIALRDCSIKTDSLQVARSIDLSSFARRVRWRWKFGSGGGGGDDAGDACGGQLAHTINMLSVNVPQSPTAARRPVEAPSRVDSPRSALVLFRNGIGIDSLTVRFGAADSEVLNTQLLLSALRKEYDRICEDVSVDDFIESGVAVYAASHGHVTAASSAVTPASTASPQPVTPAAHAAPARATDTGSSSAAPGDTQALPRSEPGATPLRSTRSGRGWKDAETGSAADSLSGLGRVERNRLRHLRDNIQHIADTAARMNQKELAQASRLRSLRQGQEARFERRRHVRDEARLRRDAQQERLRQAHEEKYSSVMKKTEDIHTQVADLRQRLADRQRARGQDRRVAQDDVLSFRETLSSEQDTAIVAQAREAQDRHMQKALGELARLDQRQRDNINAAYERELALMKSMHQAGQQKILFMAKQERDRHRLEEFKVQKQEERWQRSAAHAQLEESRVTKYVSNHDAILARARVVQQKQQEKEERLMAQISRVEQRRAESHRANVLLGQQRNAHVRRTQQQQEFHRMVTLQTIHEKSERVEEIARQRTQAMRDHEEAVFQRNIVARAMTDALKREERKALEEGFKKVQEASGRRGV